MVYREDSVTKTNDGGLNHMRKQRKVVWVYPSNNKVRCPVRLTEKYMSLCPSVTPKTKKFNFYLQSLEKPSFNQWYGEQVVGLHTLSKTVKELLKSSKLNGFFTNHSLRRTGTTRLFQKGVDRKLVKEFTGHVSDAVDKYQITSDEQRETISKIIRGEKCTEVPKPSRQMEISVQDKSGVSSVGCSCSKQNVQISEISQVGTLINDIVSRRKESKTVIKLEISFEN